MKKVMFLGLVLSVVSLGSAMANNAYAPLDGKPKNVVINVNMPPAGGPVEHFNPGGCPPPPPKGACNCHNHGAKFHKEACHHNHHNAPKPRPHKGNHNFNGKPAGVPYGKPVAPAGRPGGAPNSRPNGAPNGRPGGK